MAESQTSSETAETASGAISPLSGNAVLEMVLWLAVVIAFILLCAWVFRRVNGNAFAAGGVIKMLAGFSLGGRDRIALVQVGGKQILLGISPGRINALHVFDEEVVPRDQAAPGSYGGRANSEFAGKLQSLLNRDNSVVRPSGSATRNPSGDRRGN